jgi:NAD(P)-dependent dehydrogenase (short-subunit alcohol dehydrogenase family)
MPEPTKYHERLLGRTAIVTGAGTEGDGVGIGRAISVVLAGEGARVCLVDRDAEQAEKTGKRIVAGGGECFIVTGDVTNGHDCERFVAATVERYGRLDILVNNVGVSNPLRLDTVAESDWNRVFDINLKSAMLMSKYAVSAMTRSGGGSITNIGSIAGIRAHGAIAYGPSKAAMAALAREIAVAHGRDGIRANTVAPGHILTPHASHVLPPDARTSRRKVGPLGIEGDAWDVALAVLYLVSDDARFITGILLPVDGGVTEIGPLAAHALLSAGEPN